MHLKPGYRTTEFWGTIIVHLFALIGIVYGIDTTKYEPLIPALALVASSVAQSAYSIARARTKGAVAVSNATAPATVK